MPRIKHWHQREWDRVKIGMNAPIREEAAKYATRECGPQREANYREWQRAFNGYFAGHLAANRKTYAELRVKLKQQLKTRE